MHDKKMAHIEEMDRRLDDEIIEAIEKFKKTPTPANLELYTMLMKADHYTDSWLEKYGEDYGDSHAHGSNKPMAPAGPPR